MVPDGNFVPKWQLENAQRGVNDCGHYNRIRDLENKLEKCKETYYSPREVSVTIDGQRYKVI